MASSFICHFSTLTGDVLLKPIIETAGKDISHWFDKKTKDVSNNNHSFEVMLLSDNVSTVYTCIDS